MAATCKVLLKIEYDYTPTVPITSSSTAHYKIKDSSGSTIEYTKNYIPASGDEVALEGIQDAGEYELTLTLNINGATSQKVVTFKVDKCDISSCTTPSVDKVYLATNDQIVMDYTVDSNSLYAVEYQIATDAQFTNIVHFKVIMGADYNFTEYIEMNDGTILNNTTYYVRARKHCSKSEMSGWSNVVEFISGKWVNLPTLYRFDFAYLVPGQYDGKDPRDIGEGSICSSENNRYIRKVYLTTSVPEIGSIIYNSYSNPPRPAIKGDLLDFEDISGGGNLGFNDYGIRWVRFEKEGVNPSVIYDVEPSTGKIISISPRYTCNY